MHARGGGERGRAWHDAGRGLSKTNTFMDTIAGAHELLKCARCDVRLLGT